MLLGLSGWTSVSEAVEAPVRALFPLGPTELIIVLLIIVLLFGGSKLPQLARGLGQGLKEFKQASREELSDAADEKEKDKDA